VPDCLDAGIDLCPGDPAKTIPGTCGCGTSDADLDRNGVPDCLDAGIDLCPDDPAKTQGGVCGCGLSDADANGNGVPDCLDAGIDLCPADPAKTVPGTCGCGTSDADLDGNGVPDCLDAGIDLCPADPAKTQAGACGCGTSDADANGNLIPDCFDQGIVTLCDQGWSSPDNGICGVVGDEATSYFMDFDALVKVLPGDPAADLSKGHVDCCAWNVWNGATQVDTGVPTAEFGTVSCGASDGRAYSVAAIQHYQPFSTVACLRTAAGSYVKYKGNQDCCGNISLTWRRL